MTGNKSLDEHMSMGLNICGTKYDYPSATYSNQEINTALINALFNTNYTTIEQARGKLGNINCEIFNDYSCESGGHHRGIDFNVSSAGDNNIEIYSPFQSVGEVTRVDTDVLYTNEKGQKKNLGGIVAVWYKDFNVTVIYLHVDEVFVNKGEKIEFGKKIAEGSNPPAKGNSNHLHFEVKEGKQTAAAPSGDDATIKQSFDPRALFALTNGFARQINDGIDIYGGSNNFPRTNATLSISSAGLNSNFKNDIIGFDINGVNKMGDIKFKIISATISAGKGNIILDFPTVSSNKLYDLTITITGSNGKPMTYFGSKQVYYINENNIADVKSNQWFEPYVRKGVKYGFFKGGFDETIQNYKFNPDATIKRGDFAKVIVTAAVNMGKVSINTSTQTHKFSDVNPSDYFFPYVQTLVNLGVITKNSEFDPKDEITTGQASKIIVNLFNLKKNKERSIPNITGYGNATDIKPAVEILYQLVDWKYSHLFPSYMLYESVVEALFPISKIENPFTIDCSKPLYRSVMAKVICNVYELLNSDNKIASAGHPTEPTIDKNNDKDNKETFQAEIDMSKVTIIGNKFEMKSNGSGSITVGNLQPVTLKPGESYTFNKSSNSNGFFFYWSVNGGKLEDLAPTNAHNKVKFTAPTNLTKTETYDLYMYTGYPATGLCGEAFCKITVEVPNPTPVYNSYDVGKLRDFLLQGNNLECVRADNSITRTQIQSSDNSWCNKVNVAWNSDSPKRLKGTAWNELKLTGVCDFVIAQNCNN